MQSLTSMHPDMHKSKQHKNNASPASTTFLKPARSTSLAAIGSDTKFASAEGVLQAGVVTGECYNTHCS
jgi:hypothetical protein